MEKISRTWQNNINLCIDRYIQVGIDEQQSPQRSNQRKKTAHGKRQTENEKRKKKSIVAAIFAQAIEIIF